MSEKRPFTFGNEVIADQVKEIDRLTKLVQETRRERDALQAKIDALMLKYCPHNEYCPHKIRAKQFKEWARNQKPVDAETEKAADDAARRKP
jgi:hypothetical protein